MATEPKLKRLICAECGHIKELYMRDDFCSACIFMPTTHIERSKPGINYEVQEYNFV